MTHLGIACKAAKCGGCVLRGGRPTKAVSGRGPRGAELSEKLGYEFIQVHYVQQCY